jgi:hypothetical protein
MGIGCVGFFGFLGERGREALQGEKTFFPCLQRVHGKKMANSAIKTTPFAIFF